jgi:NAD-dependent deacetylase
MTMNKNNSIVILTGAGISAESGLKTFRGEDGLWENHPIEDVASIDGYERNPRLVQEFYNMRRAQVLLLEIKPNKAHQALAELEKKWQGPFLLVTQNVDDLHERAGSEKLIHMHGEVLKVRCKNTDEVFEWRENIDLQTLCPCCQETKTLRPHIVWFGEMPFQMEKIYESLETCDIFISIGTSGLVYPAAGFVRAASSKARTIEVNLEPTSVTSRFQEKIFGSASLTVPPLVQDLLTPRSN